LKAPDKNKGGFDNPRDHYNHGFRLLNQTRYEDAARTFEAFTEKYPKDPLIGNAYYWLGETYYIRRDYVKAADSFRQGFEVLPSGPKAADNLLKLSMALSAMKKQKEACVVLDQLLVKFKDSSTSVAKKADAERTRIGCR
jgi:tol-pal system protein YbgF